METPSLEGLPIKAKEDPSPHEMRVFSTRHQPSISWSQRKVVIIVIIIIIIILFYSFHTGSSLCRDTPVVRATTIPTFKLMPSVSIHPLKPLLMHSRAPTTTGTTSTFFRDQSLFSSLSLQILLFFNLFGFFLMYPTIIWYSNINDGA